MKSQVLIVLLAASTAFAGSASAAPALPRIAGDNALVHKVQQVRDADVFFDGRGNEVLVDRETGEVISIRPIRRAQRRAAPQNDGYFREGDGEDVQRLRREWEQEFRRDANRRYDPYEDPYNGQEIYPDTPDPSYEEPAPARPRTITRRPLPAPGETPPAETAPGVARPTETARTEEPTVSSIIEEGGAVKQPPISAAAHEEVAGLQILLDRAGASPGVIDGRFGSNLDKALVAYRAITGRNLKSTDTAEIQAQLAATGGDPFTTYTITQEDVAGPYVASVPDDYSQKAQLEELSYTSVPEMLGERFHMDEKYLRQLNPEANFNAVGTIIRVANVGSNVTGAVARIIADKGNKQVRALDENGRVIAAYPASIGSTDTPSPVGVHAVSRIALNPNYTYNPKLNFKQGENDKILTIPPGPNGPVGSVWIALDKPTYGIHGTPEPSKIGRTESHGCVRLTNWDAKELAKIVKAGVPVEFLE